MRHPPGESMSASSTLAIHPNSLPDEDTQLVLAAQKNPVLFQALYTRWAIPVYQYFFHRTGEISSAEDLTSQLFLVVYKSLPRYQHRGHFAAWLFTIARNLSKEHYRKQRREVPLEMAQRLASPSDPSSEFAQTDEIRHLIQLIQSLPEDEQELIRLRYVVDLNFADMAIILRKREDAVKKSLYRLQTRLKSQLEKTHE
jgi:RNA polymerase sigma-70 factor, ECF subfamily